MRQQIDLGCLQSSVASPLTLERAAAECLCTCKINKRGEKTPSILNQKRKGTNLFYAFGVFASEKALESVQKHA